jgi:hypothetical protein
MEVKFTRPFEKDLKAVKDKSVVFKTDEIIKGLRAVNSLSQFANIKMLNGYKHCYRIRIGN